MFALQNYPTCKVFSNIQSTAQSAVIGLGIVYSVGSAIRAIYEYRRDGDWKRCAFQAACASALAIGSYLLLEKNVD